MFLSGKVSDVTSGQQLITETFTSSTTWTAPSGVTNLISVEGKGSDGTDAYWSDYFVNLFIGPDCGGNYPEGATLSWSTALGKLDSMISAANQITTSPAGSTGYNVNWLWSFLWCSSQGQWLNFTGYNTNPSETWRRTGTLYNPYSFSGNVPTSTYSNYSAQGGRIEKYIPGTPGSSATGFSRSFPSGSVTTFTDVSVTPGQSYTLSIPSPGGYITIRYYQ